MSGWPTPCAARRRATRPSAWKRSRLTGEEGENAESAELTPERYAELGALEQFVLTLSEKGYGKRTSAYEYRISGRGGKGIIAMIVNERNGKLISSFPVEDNHQIMLVTDGGQLIRCPVNGISVVSRSTQGVRIFNTAAGEQVVSVEPISDSDDGNGNGNGTSNGNGNGNGDGDERGGRIKSPPLPRLRPPRGRPPQKHPPQKA